MEGTARAATGKRMYFLDNLRTIIIFLVVVYHAGYVYESSGIGALFWIVDDPATNHVAGILNMIFDAFLMPTIFFISGYLAPMSLARKGRRAFLIAKLRRLMVPWLIAVLTLVPLYKVIFLYSRGIPQQNWMSYFHFSNGGLSQVWLWFLPVLFLFDLLYVLLSALKLAPARVPLKLAILIAFLISFMVSFGIDMMQATGWTKTVLLDFQNEKVLVYFAMFLLGTLCFQQKAFAKPQGRGLYSAVAGLSWIPIGVYVHLVIVAVVTPGAAVISPLMDKLLMWLSLYLSLLCLVYLAIETARRYLGHPGRVWDELNRDSYYVYIIHVIVLGVIALSLLNSVMPSLLKYVILTMSSYLASNLIISLYRRATTRRSAIGPAQVAAR